MSSNIRVVGPIAALLAMASPASSFAANCTPNTAPYVYIGYERTPVPNCMTSLGKNIDDLIQDEAKWPSQLDFKNHVYSVTAKLLASKDINETDKAYLDRAAHSSGVGQNGLVEELAESPQSISNVLDRYRAQRPSFDSGSSLGGNDQNNDGVRDDVAALIGYMGLLNEARITAASAYARALRAVMVAPAFGSLTIDQAYSLQQNVDFRKRCLSNLIGVASGQLVTDLIRAATINTPVRRARLDGFDRALSGSSYDTPQNPACY